MSYCTKCGTEVPEGSAFCNACGNRMVAAAPMPVEQPAQGNERLRKKLHCPECKGRKLSASVENWGQTGGAYRMTNRVAVGSSRSINHTYWICGDCGIKFRNVQDLEKEVKAGKAVRTLLAIMTVLFILLSFVIIFMLLPMVVLLGFTVGTWISLHKKEKELAYLQVNCFD